MLLCANAFQSQLNARGVTKKSGMHITNVTVTENVSEVLLINRVAPLSLEQYTDTVLVNCSKCVNEIQRYAVC